MFARAYQLQILESERLTVIAREGYMGMIKLPQKRGTLYDREGHELGASVEAASIYAHPGNIADKAEAAGRISVLLGKKPAEVRKLMEEDRPFVWLKRKIAPDQASQVIDSKIEGVGVLTETRRFYPGREIAAHLLGFVGIDNQGLEGLEKKYDSLLRGPEVDLLQIHDALARPFSITEPPLPAQGTHDLLLTIDKDIQYKAQQALKGAVAKTGARAGHCLVVDAWRGEILAMAVVPEFDPNVFWQHQPDQWRNRTITDCFEPGSTIKAFLLAAALEERAVSLSSKFDCEQGRYRIRDHVIHDTREHGVLSVSEILVHSSNIGAVKIGESLGYKKFYEYLRKFGFGSKTGIDLLGEREGFIRPLEQAGPVDQATLFFGQGMTVTSIQMAMAMAAIANGGKLMRPYVVKRVTDESGHAVEEIRPGIVRRVLSEKTAKRVASLLEGVVSRDGTGFQASIEGFRVAGKTGTAQKVDPETKRYSDERYMAAFFGFVPADRPKLVIHVVIDEPKSSPYGSVVAAPVFREVGQWALTYLRIAPQQNLPVLAGSQGSSAAMGPKGRNAPSSGKQEGPRHATVVHAAGSRGVLPDFRGLGMRRVCSEASALGLKVVLEGTGVAVNQDPKPGSPLREIGAVRVSFKPPA